MRWPTYGLLHEIAWQRRGNNCEIWTRTSNTSTFAYQIEQSVSVKNKDQERWYSKKLKVLLLTSRNLLVFHTCPVHSHESSRWKRLWQQDYFYNFRPFFASILSRERFHGLPYPFCGMSQSDWECKVRPQGSFALQESILMASSRPLARRKAFIWNGKIDDFSPSGGAMHTSEMQFFSSIHHFVCVAKRSPFLKRLSPPSAFIRLPPLS